jgi:dienelactone hydrolase
MDLEGPYLEGGVQLERDVMADRFGATTGENAPLSGITRVLDEERMWVRLPAGYDPARPAGVVVWVSPSETWRIPGQFFGTLDEHNLIACGVDNAGNFRKTRDGSTHGIVDRLQLMFDVLQTVRSRFEVDDERIYITGFSGGGRVSSILTCTFPEIFRGATPIVGLDSYAPATVAEGKYVPGRFPKPRGARWKLLTSRRIWALTGSKDFNLVEMKARVEQMAKDGLAIRLHSTPGMEHHEMPAEAVVREALEWVDEPAREAMEAGWARADELWDAYVEAHGERLPPGEAPRAQLIEITRVGPFGESAWKAAELLGYTRPVRPGVSP